MIEVGVSGTALFDVQAPSLRRGSLTEPQQVVDPDAAAVAAARNDPAAFVALYDRYLPLVHRYVTLRVRDATTAEDLTSDVSLTALSRLDSFRARGSFSAWIFRIAQNAVHDHHRRRRPLDSLEKA